MTLKTPRQQIPVVDPNTGHVTREWNNYFSSLSGALGQLSVEDSTLITLMLHSGLKALAFARVGAFQS